MVDALLLRPLPYSDPSRLAAIWLHSPGIGIFRDWPSPGEFTDLRNESHSFEEMALAQSRSFTLTGRDRPQLVDAMRGQSSLLRMLGATPLLGRLLTAEEDLPGKPMTALLSYGIWRRMFGANPKIVGSPIVLNGNPYTVVGVLRPEFTLNAEVMPSEDPMDKMDLFLPLPLGADAAQRRSDENYNILVRLKRGVSIQQAQADVNVIADRIRKKDHRDVTFGMHLVGLQEQVVGDVQRVLLVPFGSVALVLLIARANVANLLLARAAGRQRDMAIRLALGARWQALVRQLLSENVLLGVMGGLVGLGIAQFSIYLVRTINPGNIPRLDEIAISGSVLAFTLGVLVATGVLFGTAPAWRAARVDVNASLKAGGRSGHASGGLGLTRLRLRGLLVVAQVAFSLILLIAAGLLVQSFARLQQVPPGFTADHVLTMQVAATGPKYRGDQAAAQFFRNVDNRVSHLPGVEAEGFVSVLPLSGGVGWGEINVEGYQPPPGQELQVDTRIASTDYFRAMQMPLVKGRFFSDHDTADAQRVAIIDQKFANRFWPRDSPVGKHLWFNSKEPFVIAGVVGVVKQYGLDADSKIALYFAEEQQSNNGMFLVARTASDPSSLSGAVVKQIQAVDPGVVVYGIRTMNNRLYDSLARQRFASTMLGIFAIFALLLATVGVYGVMSYLVSEGTHDIGLRVALGARQRHSLSLVLRQGMTLTFAGVLAGLAGGLALTRVMAGLLFGITALDAPTFAVVGAILIASALTAAFIPAQRAARIDPTVAIREE